jgi:hypothetical protein
MRMQMKLSSQLTQNTMTEPSHGVDESLVDLDEDDQVREQLTSSEPSKGLLYLLVLTCGGAG